MYVNTDSKPSSSSTSSSAREPVSETTQTEKQRTSSMRDLWNIPTVREITVSLFCLKFVRYGKLTHTKTKL